MPAVCLANDVPLLCACDSVTSACVLTLDAVTLGCCLCHHELLYSGCLVPLGEQEAWFLFPFRSHWLRSYVWRNMETQQLTVTGEK